MNQTLKNVHSELQQALDLIGFLSEQEYCSQIDIDILIQRMQNAYEQLIQVKKLSTEDRNKSQQNKENASISEEKTEEQATPIELDVYETAENKNIEPEIEITQDKVEKEEEAKQKFVSDKFKAEKASVNESLAKNQEKNLAAKLTKKPVQNISSAIGINDRFLFIKELFQGNTELFKNTVATLDNFSNLEQAMSYIEQNFNWDAKNNAVQQFITLIKRKFTQ